MKRHLNFTIILFASILCLLGQRTYSQTARKNYDTEIKENFKKLDFNWALTPQYQEVLNKGLSSLEKAEWKSALDFFDKVIEFDSTFLPGVLL